VGIIFMVDSTEFRPFLGMSFFLTRLVCTPRSADLT
jgi:hypothetical protein